MKLHQHADFLELIAAAANDYELPPAFIEKDYWITEVLRMIAATLGDRAIFKGGTSLSKGWGLLDRFSEDIDLFVNPAAKPELTSSRAVDRALKHLRDAIEAIDGLEFDRAASLTIGGFGRNDVFRYRSNFPLLEGSPATILLEASIQSGDHPVSEVEISSLVGSMIADRAAAKSLGVEDLQPFSMSLLHYRRTFVEKLFAIHGKVERLQRDGVGLGRDARHYADLYVLAGVEEVQAMLDSDEYGSIAHDYDEKSRKYFPRRYRPPAGLRFSESPALFPGEELREAIEPVYEDECRRLFYRPPPNLDPPIRIARA